MQTLSCLSSKLREPPVLCCVQGASGTEPSSSLSSFPSHLAHVKKSGSHHITCSALSPDGSLLAFADIAGTRCYQVSAEATHADLTNGAASGADASQAATADVAASDTATAEKAKPILQRVSLPEALPAFQEMQFRSNSTQLVGLTPEGKLVVVDHDSCQVSMCLGNMHS